MKIRAEQLEAQLSKRILPAYLVAGDEPLLLGECLDVLRSALRRAGYTERQVCYVERGFDWGAFATECNSFSLFAERRFLELRLATAKPGEAAARSLLAYAANPPADMVLIVAAPKLDAKALRAKWVGALDASGAVVQVWPVPQQELPVWIAARMRRVGLAPERDAVLALANRTEGNLLAAQQEIDKLWLQKGEASVTVEDVESAVGDSARFSVFKLADAAVAGDGPRALRMLGSLRTEGAEPVLLSWALAREIRSLASLRARLEQGNKLSTVLAEARVWSTRQGIVRACLGRHSVDSLYRLVAASEHVDRVIKGRAPGSAWNALLGVVVALSGAHADLPAIG